MPFMIPVHADSLTCDLERVHRTTLASWVFHLPKASRGPIA